MARPEYLICLECESPCYVFEYKEGVVTEIMCEVCGEEEPELFATSEEFEGMQSADSGH